MSSSDTLYTARFLRPVETIEQGRTNALQCAVYRNGALVSPSSGTCYVYRGDGTLFVSGAVSIVGSIATYSVSGLSAESLGEGWRVEWSLVMPDGVTHQFRRDAALVLRSLYPVISDLDLFARHTDLNPAVNGSLAGSTANYQGYIDAAWYDIESRLTSDNRRSYLILSPVALREVHIFATLELVFRDFQTSLSTDGKYSLLAKEYEVKARDAWSRVSFHYDDMHLGQDNDPNKRKAAQAPVWLGSGRPTWSSYSPGTQTGAPWRR